MTTFLATRIYTGDGTTTDFVYPFERIRDSHVFVKVSGILRSYTWVDPSTVRILPAPAAGTRVKIYRSSSPELRLTNYTNTGGLGEAVLNTDSRQAFFLAQEFLDRLSEIETEIIGLDPGAINAEIINQINSLRNELLPFINAAQASANAALAGLSALAGRVDALEAIVAAIRAVPPGGSAGQVLTANGSGGYGWANPAGSSGGGLRFVRFKAATGSTGGLMALDPTPEYIHNIDPQEISGSIVSSGGGTNNLFKINNVSGWSWFRATAEGVWSGNQTTDARVEIIVRGTSKGRTILAPFSPTHLPVTLQATTGWISSSIFTSNEQGIWVIVGPGYGGNIGSSGWLEVEFA